MQTLRLSLLYSLFVPFESIFGRQKSASPMKLEKCLDEILKRGADDWVDAAEVVFVVRSLCAPKTDADARQLSIDAVRELVNRDLASIGDIDKNGFHEWNDPIDQALRKIQDQWVALTRDPIVGELFWLCNTDKGDQKAKSLLHASE
jgi:hypothetical protein